LCFKKEDNGSIFDASIVRVLYVRDLWEYNDFGKGQLRINSSDEK
jgi:hypothetical protein